MSNSPLQNKSAIVECGMYSLFDKDLNYQTARNAYLAGIISQITIYENIFSPTLSGEIDVLDTSNLSSGFTKETPMIGLEYFVLKFGVFNPRTKDMRWYGNTSPLVFSAYGQVNRIPQSMGAHSFRLKLVSAEFMASVDTKICRKYPADGVSTVYPEDIIKDILTTVIPTQKSFSDIEKTKNPISLTIPFLTPLETIKLLSLQSQSAGGVSNYLFYENLDGFHFKSISKMISEGQKKSIPVIRHQLAGLAEQRNTDLSYTADVMDLISGYNFLYTSQQGYFGSTTYALDILSGQCKETVSRPTDPKFQDRPMTNGNNAIAFYPFDEKFIKTIQGKAKIFVVPSSQISSANTQLVQKDPSIRNNFFAETLDNRVRELTALQSRTIRIKVAGAPELTAGSLIDVVFLPPHTVKGSVVPPKDIASGRYLIISAKHTLKRVLNTGEFLYETVFEACSDSHSTT